MPKPPKPAKPLSPSKHETMIVEEAMLVQETIALLISPPMQALAVALAISESALSIALFGWRKYQNGAKSHHLCFTDEVDSYTTVTYTAPKTGEKRSTRLHSSSAKDIYNQLESQGEK